MTLCCLLNTSFGVLDFKFRRMWKDVQIDPRKPILSNSFHKFGSLGFQVRNPKLLTTLEPLMVVGFWGVSSLVGASPFPTGERNTPPYRGGISLSVGEGISVCLFFNLLLSPHLGDQHD